MGSSSYYLALTAASLAVGIYNFSSGSAGTSLKCFTMAKMDNTTFQAYKSSFGNVTIEFTPPANASDPKPETSDNANKTFFIETPSCKLS